MPATTAGAATPKVGAADAGNPDALCSESSDPGMAAATRAAGEYIGCSDCIGSACGDAGAPGECPPPSEVPELLRDCEPSGGGTFSGSGRGSDNGADGGARPGVDAGLDCRLDCGLPLPGPAPAPMPTPNPLVLAAAQTFPPAPLPTDTVPLWPPPPPLVATVRSDALVACGMLSARTGPDGASRDAVSGRAAVPARAVTGLTATLDTRFSDDKPSSGVSPAQTNNRNNT